MTTLFQYDVQPYLQSVGNNIVRRQNRPIMCHFGYGKTKGFVLKCKTAALRLGAESSVQI